ncbi:MAG: methyltransferase domain-containing protein [Snowella sp.]|nr:methyltransferase domain-containing protein [Snowella sp.]
MIVQSPSASPYKDIIAYSQSHKVTALGLLIFELKSWIGRSFFLRKRKPQIDPQQINLLHLGSGWENLLKDWTNADFFMGFQFWKRSTNELDWMLDLRYPLNCTDNVWDGIFTEHTLEHLYPDQALNLLKELYRTLKPGSWLRITVPDLQKYVDYYEGRRVGDYFYQYQTGCEAIHTLTQNHQHLSVWNSELLGRFLKEAGFTHVKEVSFKKGTDLRLCQDREARREETLYMEAQKPNTV